MDNYIEDSRDRCPTCGRLHHENAALRTALETAKARLSALEPGTIEAITDALWEFAEKECGHDPLSAKHALDTVVETVHSLRTALEKAKTEAQIAVLEELMARMERGKEKGLTAGYEQWVAVVSVEIDRRRAALRGKGE